MTFTGSQLGGCNGWTASGGFSPADDDGWRMYIGYHPGDTSDDEGLMLNDGHVYFSTDVGTGHGLYCPMSNHYFSGHSFTSGYFNCYWLPTKDITVYSENITKIQ